MENNSLNDPQVTQYFHLSNELAATINDLQQNRGATLRDEVTRDYCIVICANCIHFNAGRCGICSCGVNLRVRISTMHCPLAKW